MNIVFFSPHFPQHYFHFCEQLHAAGATVLGIGDAPEHELRPELRAALRDYVHVANPHRYDQLLRATGYLTYRHGKLDRYESLNEYWLESDARIRTDFDIDGLKTDAMPDIRRKSRMKEVFRRAGLRVAPGEVAATLEDARRVARAIGYPLVAKPDSGVGGADTHRVDDDGELARVYAAPPAAPFILERFVDGRTVTFDGLTDRAGRVVFSVSHEYSHNVLEVVDGRLNPYYTTMREIAPDLDDAGRRCLAAFGVRERFFHLEFFRPTDGSALVALEVNMRPPGGLLVDMMNYACDLDLYRQWANVLLHDRFDAPWSRNQYCSYVGRRADRAYALSHAELVSRLGSALVQHQPMDPLSRSVMCDYGYVVRYPELDDIHRAARLIHLPAGEDPDRR
jgi:hypothetical protein